MFKIEKQTVVMAATCEIARIDVNKKKKEYEFTSKNVITRALIIIGNSGYYPDFRAFQEACNEGLARRLLKACSIMIGDYVDLDLDEASNVADWLKTAANS